MDRVDQLSIYNPGLRPTRCKDWQAIEYWLLKIILINYYLLLFYNNILKPR